MPWLKHAPYPTPRIKSTEYQGPYPSPPVVATIYKNISQFSFALCLDPAPPPPSEILSGLSLWPHWLRPIVWGGGGHGQKPTILKGCVGHVLSTATTFLRVPSEWFSLGLQQPKATEHSQKYPSDHGPSPAQASCSFQGHAVKTEAQAYGNCKPIKIYQCGQIPTQPYPRG